MTRLASLPLLAALMMAPAALAAGGDDPPKLAPAPKSAADVESVQDVIFLGENRPIFLRLRIAFGDRPLRTAWHDSVRALHQFLDRNSDGTVSRDEADRGTLGTIVRIGSAGAGVLPRTELDNHPKDGVVTVEELTDALRTALGPFRVQVGRLASGKTDALFGQLDRDKDGTLTVAELAAASTSLGRLDLDDDELIGAEELEPFVNPMAMQDDGSAARRAALTSVPPVLELTPGDASLRPVRHLLQRYDKGNADGSAARDNRLSRSEFALAPAAFARADADADGTLDTEELRRFLGRMTPEVELRVGLSPDASGRATVEALGPDGSPGSLPAGVKAKPLGADGLELSVDEVRLEVRIDDGANAAASAKQVMMGQFRTADANNDGYLEKSEVDKDKDHPSPLSSLFDLLDRDADGKLYPKEVEDFVDRQSESARTRTVLTASDRGRAIFALLDGNRDGRLGLRELRSTIAQVASWDRDGDGKVTSDEIPHHYHLSLARGGLPGIQGGGALADTSRPTDPVSAAAQAGPSWFHRMDRNRDGDISGREFLGPRNQFERLDLDKDGLIDAREAEATAVATSRGK